MKIGRLYFSQGSFSAARVTSDDSAKLAHRQIWPNRGAQLLAKCPLQDPKGHGQGTGNQFVLLQRSAEVEDGGFVRDALQAKAYETGAGS